MTIQDIQGFRAGIKVLEEAEKETEAQLRAMDGVCRDCAQDGGKLWPKDTSGYFSGPCHSCGEKADTVLVPWSDMVDGYE